MFVNREDSRNDFDISQDVPQVYRASEFTTFLPFNIHLILQLYQEKHVQKVSEGKNDFGYNARTDTFENRFSTGVIDPAKVARVALENAASIAGMMLTTECVIADKKEDNPVPAMPPMGGGMGGMM